MPDPAIRRDRRHHRSGGARRAALARAPGRARRGLAAHVHLAVAAAAAQRLLALVPATLRRQLLLLHGSDDGDGETQRRLHVAVGAEGIDASGAQRNRL